MKTFSTEKHNIPEGATHYADETNGDYFAWIKFIDGKQWRMMPHSDNYKDWHCQNTDGIKPIPQQEVEWKNGEILDFNGEPCVFIGMSDGSAIVRYTKDADSSLAGGIDEIFAIECLSKPDPLEEKEKRERANAIYDMCTDADIFTNESSFWAGKFYDLGYRK